MMGGRPEVQTATPSPVHLSLWVFKAGSRLLNVPHQHFLLLIPFQAPSVSSRGEVGVGSVAMWGLGAGSHAGCEWSCPSGWSSSLSPASICKVPSSSFTRRANEEIMDSNRQIDYESKRMRQL